MNKSNKIWLITLGIGTIVLISLGVIYRKTISKRLSAFKKKLVSDALAEWEAWNKEGRAKEGSSKTMERLRKYWKEGTNTSNSDSYYINTPWSATFISYLFKKAGAGKDFKYNPSHSSYIVSAIKNRKENNKNPFKGYKPNEVKVEEGDLVCFPRQAGINYNSVGNYKGHCDLVVKVEDSKAVSIGGNVSDSVTKTIVPLKDGKIDMSKQNKGYFVVIKNNK